MTLLRRHSRNVALTAAGEALLREGRKTMRQSRRAIEVTRAAERSGRLTVGFYGSAGNGLLPRVISAYGERHPAIEVSVRELLFGSIDDLIEGRVELALTRLEPGQTELEVEVIAKEPRLVALASTHPLATRESVRFQALRDESFIVNPAMSSEGPPLRWLNEQRRHGLPGRVAAQTASIQEILTLVASGRGVCLVPASVPRHYARDDVTFVPVSDADPALVSVAWRQGAMTPLAKAFLETARQVAANENANGN